MYTTPEVPQMQTVRTRLVAFSVIQCALPGRRVQPSFPGAMPGDATARDPSSPTATTPQPSWAEVLAAVVGREVRAGRRARVSLPQSASPATVEDARVWAGLLVLQEAVTGTQYYLADPAGVVLVLDPVRQGDQRAYWAGEDG